MTSTAGFLIKLFSRPIACLPSPIKPSLTFSPAKEGVLLLKAKLRVGKAPNPAVVRSEVERNFLREKFDLLMGFRLYGF